MAFLDDVLVYSDTLDEHVKHIQCVLQHIRRADLNINSDKIKLCRNSLEFLAHIISPGECGPDQDKVLAVLHYPSPTTVKQLQAFLGLAGCYQSFIPQFSLIAHLLTSPLKKDAPCQWTNHQEDAFGKLKDLLAHNAVVNLPDLNQPFVVKMDASGIEIVAVYL